jgi:hypothetical protein
MRLETVQAVVKKALPKIKRYYGLSNHQDGYPYISYEESIYDKPLDNKKEDDTEGEFVFQDNEIVIYYPAMRSKKHIVQTLIHEYQHYLQSPRWFQRYYNMGYRYDNHPYEVSALKEEKNYKRFL